MLLFIQSTTPTVLKFCPAQQLNPLTFHKTLRTRVRRYSISSCNIDNRQTSAKLVTPQWLFNRLSSSSQNTHSNEQSVSIIDVRGRVVKKGGRVDEGFQPVEYISDKYEYLDNDHIPNATFIDWRTIDLWGPNELLDELCDHGVERQKPICIYDCGDMLFATRLWLALLSVGCTNVHVLNGGWKEWKNQYEHHNEMISFDTACPLTLYRDFYGSEEEREDETSVLKRIGQLSVQIDDMRQIVEQNISVATNLIIDARSKKQFSGTERRAKRAGHIPTAVNLLYRLLLNEDGIGLKSDDQLQQIFAEFEIGESSQISQIVCYCNGAVASSLVFFCLVRCGCHSQLPIRNYCGSFNEWGNHDDTPIHSFS